MIDRALFGYEGQTDVLKLVSKGGLFTCLSSLFIIFVTVYSLIHNSLFVVENVESEALALEN